MLFGNVRRVENNSNGGHLRCLSGLVGTGGSDDDTNLDRILLIAALATSDELESSVHLLWLAPETLGKNSSPTFPSVSGASHSRCTLDSSSSLVASAAMKKIRSRSTSLSDPPVRTRPEMHRRYPPFELFSTRRRSQNNSQHEPQKRTTH